MPDEHIIRGVAGILVVGAALSCAIHLHLFSLQKADSSLPIATILIIGLTTLISGLQFFFPGILSELRRNREALIAGEWWRIVTPLFVQADGWKQCCFNGLGALIVCPLVEKLYGRKLLALYFLSGVLGEIFAYTWSPNGAGSSLGIAGGIGGLFAFTFLHHQEVPGFARIFSICGCVGAIVLCASRDIHGPPILIGALLAGLIEILWPKP